MIDFSEVEHSVKILKKQVDTGNIDEETFKAQLMGMVDVAEDGYYWMYGPRSKQWYRHKGTQWVPDSPGELMVAMPSNENFSNNTTEPDADWNAVDLNWFFIGVVLLGVIFALIYTAMIAVA